MTSSVLPPSAHKVRAEALARCWLAAGAAGSAAASKALDRSLTIEQHYDDQGRVAGFLLAGVSTDLVVVAGVPIHQGSVGPKGFWELLLTSDPSDVWQVDDTSLGAQLMRTTIGKAKAAEAKGGTMWAALAGERRMGEGQLDTGGSPFVVVMVDGLTEGELIRRADITPKPWRDAMPGSGEAITPHTPEVIRPAGVSARLGRVLTQLPTQLLSWEFHALASGRTVEYTRLFTDDYFVEIAAAVGLGAAGADPKIWEDRPDQDTIGEQGELADDEPDARPEGDPA